MMCHSIRDGEKCVKIDPATDMCTVYSLGGMQTRDRLGYCPVVDAGPNKKMTGAQVKVRAGQQKQKK